MKPKNVIVITVSLLVGTIAAFAAPTWVSFDKSVEEQAPQLSVLESSVAGTTIKLVTSGMWIENVKENGETYQRITLTGSSYTGEIGKPMLPVIRKLVAIPATAGVTVKVESNKEITLNNYCVYPMQPPTENNQPEGEFQIDGGFYKLSTIYPAELSEVGTPAIMNDVRLVELTINPFRYNPYNKELTVATDLTVRLDYSGYDERNVLTKKNSYFSPQWESIYRSLVLNFDNLYSSVRTSDVTLPVSHYMRYLIIYAYDFRPSECPKLQEFIDWKKQMGYIVEIKNLNSIAGINGQPDDADDLRKYIHDWWYNNGQMYPGPVSHYVLLVGNPKDYIPGTIPNYDPVKCADNSHVPTYFYYFDPPNPCDSASTSDYYYQLLTGEPNPDLYPDIALGRWCVASNADLENYVNKTFFYEKTPRLDWNPDKALMVAHYDFEGSKIYVVDSILIPFGYEDILTEYGCTGCGGTNEGVMSAIQTQQGLGIVNYRGHGIITEWIDWNYSESFSVTEIRRLNQSSFKGYPVVYNICCQNGAITCPDVESMVEAWTLHPDGGAVGALGATWNSGDRLNDVFDTCIFRGHFTHNLNCGMTVNYGKCKVIEYDQPTGWGIRDAQRYLWIGDPALDVWRAHPVQAHLEGSSSPPNILNIDVLTSGDNLPVFDAQVCVHREGGGYHDVKFTGINGRASFPFYPAAPGTYIITATNQRGPICIRPAFSQFTIYGGVGQEEPPSDIVEWNLESVSPNPMASSVTIRYSVAGALGTKETDYVEIVVFDVTGREVKILVSGEKSPGQYKETWDGRDGSGAKLPSGVYFVRMTSPSFNASRRVVLVK